MIDIIEANEDGLGIFDTETSRAANILSVQFGSLEYEQSLGIDLRFFLSEDFQFQNESFQSYLIEVLANRGINVSSILETVDSLYNSLVISITPQQTTTGLIAR